MSWCALIAGGPPVCYHANGCVGGDKEVHERPNQNPREEGGADSGGNQTVLCTSGEGGGCVCVRVCVPACVNLSTAVAECK